MQRRHSNIVGRWLADYTTRTGRGRAAVLTWGSFFLDSGLAAASVILSMGLELL